MLKTINYLSFPGGLEGSMDVFEALRLTKEHGYEALEPCIFDTGSLTLNASEGECKEIVQEAERLGVKLPSVCSGLYWSRSLGDADGDKRKQALNDLERMIQITAWLGAKTLLTIPGSVDVFFMPDRPAQQYDEVVGHAREGLAKVLPLAEEHGVKLGIENVWNKVFLSPTELRDFIDSFGSSFIGAYVDVGNVMPFGYPEQWLRILGHRVVGVHFKDFRRAVGTVEGFVDLLEGDVDWAEVVVALNDIGYEGHVAAEMIPVYKQHPMVRVANTSRAMDAILGR